MHIQNSTGRLLRSNKTYSRRGNISALAAASMTLVIGFTAFTTDVGFILHTRSQMQAAADGSVLSAALELPNGWGAGSTLTRGQVEANAQVAAQAVAVTYRVGEQPAAYLDPTRDMRFGNRSKDAQGQWVESWNVQPYNMVEVTIRRDQPLQGTSATRGDQSLPLYFGPLLGTNYTSLISKSTAVLAPGNGFYIPPGSSSTCPLLPLAIDETTWNALIQNGKGWDNYKYNSNGTVSLGVDGLKEVSLYPTAAGSLPSGNRGSVDIGSSNNSTADLSRQIRFGCNVADLAFFGGKLQIPATGSLPLNGDTGLSAGIKDDLEAIIGQPRAIPVFRSVSGPGNNAIYQIVKFVGVRVMYVKLTGSPSQKKVIIQPAPIFDGTIIRSSETLQPESIMASLQIIR